MYIYIYIDIDRRAHTPIFGYIDTCVIVPSTAIIKRYAPLGACTAHVMQDQSLSMGGVFANFNMPFFDHQKVAQKIDAPKCR